MRSIFVLTLLCFLGHWLHAATVPARLYLNAGSYLAVDSTSMPAFAYNLSPQYDPHNAVLEADPGDSIALTLINTDTVAHGFAVRGTALSLLVNAGDSISAMIPLPNSGLFIYYDPASYPQYSYLGAAGMVHVRMGNPVQRYHWNIHEFQSDWNQALSMGQSVDWSQFYPDYFTVNGRSYPHTEADSSALIRGAVGDTLHVLVANTGRAIHSIHFHGYHFRILYSSRSTVHLDWIKDTMPVESMETMVLELVPDKPGMYPVHDHNLLSLTGGGQYPYGLMLMIDIQ